MVREEKREVLEFFPNLSNGSFDVTSNLTPRYNCIAWAFHDTERWWWPTPRAGLPYTYWPAGAPADETLTAFVETFRMLGFEECENVDIEPKAEKIAIYTIDGNKPTHVARQLPTGLWTSKLGQYVDIQHDLYGLDGGTRYGSVTCIMKRSLPA